MCWIDLLVTPTVHAYVRHLREVSNCVKKLFWVVQRVQNPSDDENVSGVVLFLYEMM